MGNKVMQTDVEVLKEILNQLKRIANALEELPVLVGVEVDDDDQGKEGK